MALDLDTLFDRYKMQSEQHESTGLGMAIVKSITSLYDITIDYTYSNACHQFKLTFPNA